MSSALQLAIERSRWRYQERQAADVGINPCNVTAMWLIHHPESFATLPQTAIKSSHLPDPPSTLGSLGSSWLRDWVQKRFPPPINTVRLVHGGPLNKTASSAATRNCLDRRKSKRISALRLKMEVLFGMAVLNLFCVSLSYLLQNHKLFHLFLFPLQHVN
jgi:hypothetical protein